MFHSALGRLEESVGMVIWTINCVRLPLIWTCGEGHVDLRMFVCTWVVKLGIDECQGVMEWCDTAPYGVCTVYIWRWWRKWWWQRNIEISEKGGAKVHYSIIDFLFKTITLGSHLRYDLDTDLMQENSCTTWDLSNPQKKLKWDILPFTASCNRTSCEVQFTQKDIHNTFLHLKIQMGNLQNNRWFPIIFNFFLVSGQVTCH